MGSGQGCVHGLMACVLILVNTIFMMLGITLTALGAIAYFYPGVITNTLDVYQFIEDRLPDKLDPDALQGLSLEQYLEPAGLVLLVLGGSMFVIALLGLCAVRTKLRALLIAYAVVLGVVVFVQIAVLVMFYSFSGKITEPIKAMWSKTITSYYAGDDTQHTVYGPVSLFWTATNRYLSCCGVENYTDFQFAKNWNYTTLGFETPLSCCKYNKTFPIGDPVSATCNMRELTVNDSNYDQGCFEAVQKLVKEPSEMFLNVVIGSLVVELGLIAFAIALCQNEKQSTKGKQELRGLRKSIREMKALKK